MKEFKEKGFTLIELIVVIAILGILVLLAAPKFLGHTEDAKLVQIKNDVKVVENALEVKLLDDPDFIANKGWVPVNLETMNGYVEEGSLFDSKGKADEELQGGEFYIIQDELAKTRLNGKFIAEKGGKVYYYEKGLSFNGNDGENVGGDESDNDSKYVLAKDSDFSGESDGDFRYIGTDEYVEIPHVIKGVPVTSYYKMFEGTSVKGVKSTNKNVVVMSMMFYGSKASTLDLSEFDTSSVMYMEAMFSGSKATKLDLSNWDTSNVDSMSYMFANSKATELDLSSFDTSNVTDMSWMFYVSQATKGYAKTQTDADRFNHDSTMRPEGLTFIVHPNLQ